MCGSLWCLLLLLLCPGADEMVLQNRAISSQSRWHSYQMEKGENVINNFKRHSEGTFTNDYANYLDKIKAKDFVQWLASNKRERRNAAGNVWKFGLMESKRRLVNFRRLIP